MVKKIAMQSSNYQKEDNLAKLVGQFGLWQLLIVTSVSLIKLSSGWVQMAIIFLTPRLTFWCVEFDSNGTTIEDSTFLDQNSSSLINANLLVQNSTCYKDCLKYEYDTSPMENTIISEWDLICDRAWLASFTQMVLQFGILTGSILFGFLSDRFGRHYTFLASIISIIALGFGVPFSPNYLVFTIIRFFLGMATAGTMVISFVIVMEAIGPSYREILGCLFHIPFMVGHMTIALFAYYFRSWNTYSLALAVPPLIYLGNFFLLQESPRWLVSVGRVQDAAKIVKRAAMINKLPTTNIEETLLQMSKTTKKQQKNYSDLFRRSLRVKTACSCYMWFISGLTFFGFNQYISQTSPDPFISVAAAGAIQIPSNLLAIWLIKKFGRKATVSLISSIGGLSAILLGVVPQLYWLQLTLGTLGVSCGAIVATCLYIFSSELFPTVVRNMGLGVNSMSMRLGSMIAPFVSNLSMTAPWAPTIVFGLAPFSAALVCLLLPETRGSTLQDNMEEDS